MNQFIDHLNNCYTLPYLGVFKTVKGSLLMRFHTQNEACESDCGRFLDKKKNPPTDQYLNVRTLLMHTLKKIYY